MTRKLGIWALLLLLCSNCAVHWSLRPQSTRVQRVFIPLPDNTSMKTGPDIEYLLALRDRVQAVKSIQLVDSKNNADQVLLIQFKKSSLTTGPTSFSGDQSTESLGGLADDAYTAASLKLAVDVGLESRSPKDGTVLWKRDFSKVIQFEAANRLLESEGASSLPLINESREQILHKQIAIDFARVMTDQIVEEF